jgi:hypothetical protein
VVVNHYARSENPLQLQAEELVQYFYAVFHDVRAHEPQFKETNQALTLVSQHGLKDCRHIVDFARRESVKTNYPAQHFGAILNYVSRALADLHQHRGQGHTTKLAAEVAQPSVTNDEGARASRARGEARLAALTSAQHEIRCEQTRQEL